MVYPDNWSKYTLGCIHSVTLRDDTFLDAIATIYDPDEIRAIETTDKEEISAGYWCDTFDTPNAISPDNESYDKEQKDNTVFNMLQAIVTGKQIGRAHV